MTQPIQYLLGQTLRNITLVFPVGQIAMITMQGWMFAPRFEALRTALLSRSIIRGMAQLGERAFDSIGGEVVSTTAFILGNSIDTNFRGDFVRLTAGQNETEKESDLRRAAEHSASTIRFRVSSDQFTKVPGNPIVYWAKEIIRDLFPNNPPISDVITTREGLTTGSNATFLRNWYEVSQSNVGFSIANSDVAQASRKRWFPYVKGGGSRRWYGHLEYLVNWYNDGIELRNFSDPKTLRVRSHNYNGDFGFRRGFTWSGISSNDFAIRLVPAGFMFDAKGPMGFVDRIEMEAPIQGFLNSRIASFLLRMLAPTLDFKLTHVLSLPFKASNTASVARNVENVIQLAKSDWDAYETSWDFATPPLLSPAHRAESLEATYTHLRSHWQSMTDKVRRLEKENNCIFIDAYGLQDELTPDVSVAEITLTCNPVYRYGNRKTEAELEALLLADTIREFLSYAIGCMFGRYSLDEPGMILANQGDGIEQYLAKVPKPKFAPNADNIIPLLDRDWVDGDATTRFHAFLRITFGDERFEENLAFVETAIGKDVRKFFLRDFFADHLKRYKKWPIYWLFSSGPERAFQALVYLHRYDESTLARMRTEYVLPLQGRMAARIEQIESDKLKAAGASLRKKLQKEQDDLKRQIKELAAFEEKLRHVADQRIVLDLDDGVKANYAKFGDLLAESRAIVGAEDDE